jgi:hypothetical protein
MPMEELVLWCVQGHGHKSKDYLPLVGKLSLDHYRHGCNNLWWPIVDVSIEMSNPSMEWKSSLMSQVEGDQTHTPPTNSSVHKRF